MGPAEPASPAALEIDVTVACSERHGSASETSLRVAAGATVLDTVRASGVLERFPTIDISTAAVGVWGRVAQLDTPVRQGDRVEIYRPLAIDPKEARRKRALQLKEASKEAARRRSGNAVG